MREQTGLIHPRVNPRRRDAVAFLLKARMGDDMCAQVVVGSCDNVKRRRIVPTSSDWKARVTAAGLPSGIRAVTRELQEHVEVECEFLGVAKAALPLRAGGATVPGDIKKYI